MNLSQAKKIINNYNKSFKASVSNFREALELLKEEYGTYKSISERVEVHSTTLGRYHKISSLPNGILWKFVNNEFTVEQAYQISRLKNNDDQWLLAFYITELQNGGHKLTKDDCKEIVDIALDQQSLVQEVIRNLYGEKFEKIVPLVLPLDFNTRLALSKMSWEQKKELKDFCYNSIIERLKR